jgi:hypothetical protein
MWICSMCSFGNIVKLLGIAQRRVCSVYDGVSSVAAFVTRDDHTSSS